MTATKSNHSAYYRSQATLLAYDITDRMRANRADALNGVYDQVLKNTECDVELAPSGSLAQRDMAEWLNSLSCLLSPDAQGSVQRNGRQFTVSIEWNDNRGRIEDADANDRETFVYRTQL